MKSIITVIILLLFLSGFIPAQTDSVKAIQSDLEMIVKVRETMPIGYAYCFSGEVLKVVKGNTKDKTIVLTVLAGGQSEQDIYKLFKEDEENNVFKLSLVFNKTNEEYSHTFITGFVDSKRNSWKIIGIEKL